MSFSLLSDGKKEYICSCKCGDIQIRAELDLNNIEAEHCNCGICIKERNWCTRVECTKFKVLSGLDSTTLYDCGTNTLNHFLCKICSTKVYSYCKSPGIGEFYTISLPCINGITEQQLVSLPNTNKGLSDHGLYKAPIYNEVKDYI